MFSRRHDYQPVHRSSLDSGARTIEPLNVDDDYYKQSQASRSLRLCCGRWRWRRSGPGGRLRRLLWRCLNILLTIIGFLLVVTPIFNPSYSTRPDHYTGSNPKNERVFIAANIIDSNLIRGAWGKAVLELIDIIGNGNVFLSIYENDSGEDTKEALREFSAKVKCEHSSLGCAPTDRTGDKAIVSSHIDVDSLPKFQILPNEKRTKRLAYLAKVRNHALDPLDAPPSRDAVKRSNSTARSADAAAFDRLLFLNDVVFSPRDAADLLFATNRDAASGRASYHAACAADYISAFKFYDRFAMRDSERYQVGVPFFPWFARGEALADVMRGRDAVRVTSCWGGMVAFEAKWFARRGLMEPLRFRSEPDVFWDASECCLIHADLQRLVERREGAGSRARVFVNPYVRVAYDAGTFRWLELARRWERLFVGPHLFVSWLLGMPWGSARRLERVGDRVRRREWVYTGPEADGRGKTPPLSRVASYGRWETVERTATPGGYCGYDFLLSLKPAWKKGESMWEKIPAPPGA